MVYYSLVCVRALLEMKTCLLDIPLEQRSWDDLLVTKYIGRTVHEQVSMQR